MRVLHLAAGNLFGGVETLLLALSGSRTVCQEMEPFFALCFAGRLSEELNRTGTPPFLLGPTRVRWPWTVWRARSRLRRLLRQVSFDVVVCHACWPHAQFAPVVRVAGMPLVFWCHDVPTGRHWLERRAGRIPPDLVLANSHYTRAAQGMLFPSTPGKVLYPPVLGLSGMEVGGLARQDASQKFALRAALLTPQDAVVILQTSRLERWKGHGLLLQALGLLKEAKGWFCWIAGGPQRPEEEAYLRELRGEVERLGLAGRVRFLGQRSDISHVLAAADIHCQPNTMPEPFGIAFIEALQAGLPVVTTSLGGALEIVDESCGLLVPPGDPARLADGLRLLIAEPALRQRLAGGGPRRARQLCAPENQLGQLHAALAAITSRRGAA